MMVTIKCKENKDISVELQVDKYGWYQVIVVQRFHQLYGMTLDKKEYTNEESALRRFYAMTAKYLKNK